MQAGVNRIKNGAPRCQTHHIKNNTCYHTHHKIIMKMAIVVTMVVTITVIPVLLLMKTALLLPLIILTNCYYDWTRCIHDETRCTFKGWNKQLLTVCIWYFSANSKYQNITMVEIWATQLLEIYAVKYVLEFLSFCLSRIILSNLCDLFAHNL